MVAKLERKTPAKRSSARTAPRRRKAKPQAPTATQRAAGIGRMIALGSMVAAGMLIVVGAGALVLLATEPSKRSGRFGGWNLTDLTNSAREGLRANVPSEWRRTVAGDVSGARDFVARQARRFS